MKHDTSDAIAAEMTVPARAFASAVAACARVAEKRNTIPILGYCRVDATSAGVTVRATDLDMELVRNVEGAGFGSFAVPVHTLAKMLRDAGDDEIRIVASNGRAGFHLGSLRIALHTLPVEDYPEIAMPEPMGKVDFPEATFRWLLAAAMPCISTEETRYYLNGVFLHRHDGALRAVATDGHRIAVRTLNLDSEVPDIGMILPQKSAEIALALIGDAEATAEFSWRTPTGETERVEATKRRAAYDKPVMTKVPERIRFTTAAGTLTTKTIDGTFPDYARVIPDVSEAKPVTIDKADLARFLRAAKGLDKHRQCIKISGDDSAPRLSCASVDVGEIAQVCGGAAPAGFAGVGFNRVYLSDALPFLGDEVTILGNSPTDPHVFVSDPNTTLVIMPMRA